MIEISSASGPRWRLLLCLLWMLAAAGCATHKINWAARVGTYTYDQAVLELGPPDKYVKLDDGTVVTEWLTDRGGVYSYGPYGYAGYRGWYGGAMYSSYGQWPDYFLRLTFGPDGRLTAWKKYAR